MAGAGARAGVPGGAAIKARSSVYVQFLGEDGQAASKPRLAEAPRLFDRTGEPVLGTKTGPNRHYHDHLIIGQTKRPSFKGDRFRCFFRTG